MSDPTALKIRESHDGDMWIDTIEATSRRGLARMVKERNWHNETGCGADCSGQVFAGSAELLRAYHVDGVWVGVVCYTSSRDV